MEVQSAIMEDFTSERNRINRHVTPYIRTPLTDLTGTMLMVQEHACAKFELRMAECLEAYGIGRGEKKCADIKADFLECMTNRNQMWRVKLMRRERWRQYRRGEREEVYAPAPNEDSY